MIGLNVQGRVNVRVRSVSVSVSVSVIVCAQCQLTSIPPTLLVDDDGFTGGRTLYRDASV